MVDPDLDLDRTVVEKLDPRLGMVFGGRYRIEHKLAAGGFGAVYRGRDRDGRPVAIKVLHAELADDPSVVARFRREAAALASLTNPHTVAAYAAGEAPDGTLYLVMELLSGESLYEHYRAHGPLAWRRVVTIARGVCSSLAEAHALGIVHRDLKPANIHLEERDGAGDFVKVLDFGIAKALQTSRFASGDLTQVGQMVGTYDYMPAEQMIGSCRPQSDVFTLGVVMYEMIAGRRPYGEAKGPASQLAAVLGVAPPLLEQVPAELARVIARCIAREPEDRYADAAALGNALAPFAARKKTPSTPEMEAAKSAVAGDDMTWFDRMPVAPKTTLPGVAAPSMFPRGSNDGLGVEPPRRFASGTSPIVERATTTARIQLDRRAALARGLGWISVLLAILVVAALIAGR